MEFGAFWLAISYRSTLQHFLPKDMKGSPGSSVGKPSSPVVGTQSEVQPQGGVARPEVELSNLVMCSRLSQSQGSLRSGSSLGSVRGDEGGLYADFYGDYCPLFDNGQDPDSASLQGEIWRQELCCCWSFYCETLQIAYRSLVV